MSNGLSIYLSLFSLSIISYKIGELYGNKEGLQQLEEASKKFNNFWNEEKSILEFLNSKGIKKSFCVAVESDS
jgi:hypothetical protein